MAFEKDFSDPIRIGGYASATQYQVEVAYRLALQLQNIIRPFMLRRRKEVRSVVNTVDAGQFSRIACHWRH